MIINQLYIICISIDPLEDDSPPTIYLDGVVILKTTLQFFQSVRGGYLQIGYSHVTSSRLLSGSRVSNS